MALNKRDKAFLDFLNTFLTEERKEQLQKVLKERTKHFAVALEDIYQPHNSNAVIRSCECFGIQECHVIENFNTFRASVGVSRGAIKWVDVFKYSETKAAIKSLKDKGYRIVATTPHTEDTNLADFDIHQPAVFFFGAEKEGLSNTVIEMADEHLKIPMVGHTESLNISVSAAIILQEVSTRLKQSKIKWQLTDQEYDELLLAWTKKSTKNIAIQEKTFDKMYSTKS